MPVQHGGSAYIAKGWGGVSFLPFLLLLLARFVRVAFGHLVRSTDLSWEAVEEARSPPSGAGSADPTPLRLSPHCGLPGAASPVWISGR